MIRKYLALLLLLCLPTLTMAQEQRLFGAEFELAGTGGREALWENQKYERFQRAMEVVVRHFGGNPADIKRIDWKVPHPTKPGDRNMYRAEWTDKQGRTWKIEPEYLGPKGLDGFELVTPPLKNAGESERLLNSLKESGMFREGLKSGAHVHIDGRDLIRSNGRADALVNAILMHERFEPLIRSIFNPKRGSGVFNKDRTESTSNRFARSLAADHPELLRQLENLPAEKRTVENIERLFQQATARELKAHGLTELDAKSWKVLWKYRSLNLANVININEAIPATKGTIEFRANDVAFSDPKLHRLQVELYQALVNKSKALAAEGKTINMESLRTVLEAGADPVKSRGPGNPYELRQQALEMVEFLGLNSAEYKPYIERNVRNTRVLTEAQLKEKLATLNAPNTTTRSLTIEPTRTVSAEQLRAFESRLNQSLRLESLQRGAVDGASRVQVKLTSVDGAIKVEAKGLQNQQHRAVVELAVQQLKAGETGPWTHEARAETRSPTETVREFLRTVEGGKLSQSQTEYLKFLESQPKLARAVAETLGNIDRAPWLPDYTQRDLKFRKHDVMRQLLEIGKGFSAGQSAEAVAKTKEVVKNWAKETRVAVHTQRAIEARTVAAPASSVMSRAELRNAAFEAGLKNSEVVVFKSEQSRVEVTSNNQVRVSTEALAEINRAAEKLAPEQRVAFRRQALGLAIAGKAQPRLLASEVISRYGQQINSKAIPVQRLNPQATMETLRGTQLYEQLPGKGQIDRFAKYRRADKTLRWGEMVRDGTLKQSAGAAHFALALFLKELAVVVQTGDRLRIEEFFEGLATTDFFVTYGLFAVGAQAGNVAYSRTLQKFIKPQFVNGILRSSVVLATGMALPEIYHGTFEGKAFAINLTSLGLATAAVKGGLNTIRWVTNLKRAQQAGRLVNTANKFRRFAKVGGWFFTAAETAVVLYFGDEISSAVNSYLDKKAAQTAISDATLKFFDALNDDSLSDEEFQTAVNTFDQTHSDYRNFLYRSVLAHDALKDRRLNELAKEALRRESEVRKQLETLEGNSKLRDAILRGKTLEEYISERRAAIDAELQPKIDEVLKIYADAREKSLADVYNANRRNSGYLTEGNLEWLQNGAGVGVAGDPMNGRTDFASGFVRNRLRGSLESEIKSISGNRLQAYDDQLRVVELALSNNDLSGSRRQYLQSLKANLTDMKRRDAELVGQKEHGTGETSGLSGAIDGIGGR